MHARGAIPNEMGSTRCRATPARRRRRCLLPSVTGEASTTRCRVAPAQTNPRRPEGGPRRLELPHYDEHYVPTLPGSLTVVQEKVCQGLVDHALACREMPSCPRKVIVVHKSFLMLSFCCCGGCPSRQGPSEFLRRGLIRLQGIKFEPKDKTRDIHRDPLH